MLKLKPRLLLLALAAGLPLAAQAHMTWLLPNLTQLNGKEPVVSVDAVVSEDLFIFERALKLETLRITAPDGRALEVEGRSSARHRESFDLKLSQDGTYRISHISQSLFGSYKLAGETKRFRSTAATLDKDLPAGAELLALTQAVNRQQTFVSKEAPGRVAFAPEGQGLEFLPLGAVTDLSHGDQTRFRLLLDGQPVADAAVKLVREGNRHRYKLGDLTLKTDAQGEFTVAWSEPGRYWLGATVGERPAPGASSGTRQAPLKRASLSATFEVLPK
ncbi:DUF4198 domain-containing protein [Roseateles sp. BYS180W]|uniref:DUF4198 domain-containing protein n=1 Tax=Roseateles rivi TaxID=3299028 RepID=A0ABW7FT50_9BURK